jgi:hypothetical protein
MNESEPFRWHGAHHLRAESAALREAVQQSWRHTRAGDCAPDELPTGSKATSLGLEKLRSSALRGVPPRRWEGGLSHPL